MVLQSSTYLTFVHSSCNLQRLCIEKQHIYVEDLIPCLCLQSVPSLSHLRLVVLGESAGLSKNFIMMHPSRDFGPSLLPKLAWFHRVTAIHLWTCCRRDGAHNNQPETETLSQSPPSTQLKSFVHHARYDLTNYTTHKGWYGSEH